MAGLCYYIPGISVVSAERLKSFGLDYVMGNGGPAHTQTSKGPDGMAGVLFAFPDNAGEIISLGTADTWEKIPGLTKDVWCGFDSRNPPTAEELARPKQIGGHEVQLADGQTYLIPVARAIDGSTSLPRRLRWDGSVWTQGDVQPAYRAMFGAACRVWDELIAASETEGADGMTMTLTDECDLAVTALAVNYRIGPAEVSLLGLLDTESELSVLKAVIDLPALEVIKKKQEADAGSSQLGETDG